MPLFQAADDGNGKRLETQHDTHRRTCERQWRDQHTRKGCGHGTQRVRKGDHHTGIGTHQACGNDGHWKLPRQPCRKWIFG